MSDGPVMLEGKRRVDFDLVVADGAWERMADDVGGDWSVVVAGALDAAWATLVDVADVGAAGAGTGLGTVSGTVSGTGDIALVLTDDAQMRTLNRQYRGLDKPTNVLAFPAEPLPPGVPADEAGCLLGDVVIGRETVMREALERGRAMREHFCHLVVHGYFHLCGYDHVDDDQAAAMEALEVTALARLGIENPYDLER